MASLKKRRSTYWLQHHLAGGKHKRINLQTDPWRASWIARGKSGGLNRPK